MVKSNVLKFCFLVFSCIGQHKLFGQEYYNYEGGRERHFIYEVKEIDEFFERFNDDPGSFIRAVYNSHHTKFSIDRQKLIRSLFNYIGMTWDTSTTNKFVSDVTNKDNPIYLDFYGDNWYAELTCKFKYNSSFIIIPVIMQVEVTKNKGSKWMIAAIGPSALKSNIVVTEMAPGKIKTRCISPTSHATNFVSLKRAFNDKENLSNYFEDAYFKKSNMMSFYNAVLNNEIEFQYVTKIRYHFLVNNKWIFTVENFPREALNSGWLIDSMREVTPIEMEIYRIKLLNGG